MILLGAVGAETEREKLDQVRAEVSARRLIREHEGGTKKANEASLRAARDLIYKLDEQRVRKFVGVSPEGFRLERNDASMAALVTICEGVMGGSFAVDDSLKEKKISFSVSDSALEPFRQKFKAELTRAGISFLALPSLTIICPISDPRLRWSPTKTELNEPAHANVPPK